MQKVLYILLIITTFIFTRCTNAGIREHDDMNGFNLSEVSEQVMNLAETHPAEVLPFIDSLQDAGFPDYEADLFRAKIYSQSLDNVKYDTAIIIGERLIQLDVAKENPQYRQDVLEVLILASRLRHDNEQWLRWVKEKADLCREQGDETEALRTEAEIGIILTHLGRQEEGLKKLDDVIAKLDGIRKFNEMDACIIAMRRKVNVLYELGMYSDIIPLAQRIIAKLDDYEQHPDEYHDGTFREPTPNVIPSYCDFYRVKCYSYFAEAYANIDDIANTRRYLALYEQSPYSQTFEGRRTIAPILLKLGEYDKMLAIYDEVEQSLGTDTVNEIYSTILLHRSLAAKAKGEIDEAFDYMSRHNTLSNYLNDQLQQSEAHEYAARYRAQEQQMEIERHIMHNRIIQYTLLSVIILLAATTFFLLYTFYQKRRLADKNATLAKFIDEYSRQKQRLQDATDESEQQLSMFLQMEERIIEGRLYKDQGIQRDEIAEALGVKRETINQLLNQFANGISIPVWINNIRLSEACRMLRENPEMTVSAIADEVGLTLRNLQRLFREQYGMSPTEYKISH